MLPSEWAYKKARPGLQRSQFHQYVVENWPIPRRAGASFAYNFGSDHYLICVTFRGTHYELDWWQHPIGHCCNAEPSAGLIDTGPIRFICDDAEEFMQDVLSSEGKDPQGFCS